MARDTSGYSTEELLALIDHLETKVHQLQEREEYLEYLLGESEEGRR